eukprot:EC124374.1.p1 GENE.EC124374.1~~EC124374.1.p1  ORF type:complete len:139 (+),score=23.88 EC124374.1:67-483(+)
MNGYQLAFCTNPVIVSSAQGKFPSYVSNNFVCNVRSVTRTPSSSSKFSAFKFEVLSDGSKMLPDAALDRLTRAISDVDTILARAKKDAARIKQGVAPPKEFYNPEEASLELTQLEDGALVDFADALEAVAADLRKGFE